MKTHNKYIRETAKSLDAGVCEQCGVDGSQLFQRIKYDYDIFMLFYFCRNSNGFVGSSTGYSFLLADHCH